ncbi:MAG: dipeptidase [Henriciella sp.]|nr:dipeptidase [Henriciella sp.]
MRLGLSALAAALLAACTPMSDEVGTQISAPNDGASVTDIASLHESFTVYDSHLDIPAIFHTADYDFGDRGSFEEDGTQVDLPRMREGGLDGGFWVIYTAQGPLTEVAYRAARNQALMRMSSIRELAAKYHEDLELAFTADDADRIISEGKIVVFQSMENAYPLGEDVSLLETFYIGGLRMVSPAHFRNNQFGDSATDVSPQYDGLSPLGEELVREANRLGLILDGSHVADTTVEDMLELSTTPIILSHSGPKAIYDHPRNVPDDLLLRIAEDGGVIQVNALGAYLEELTPTPERAAGLAEIAEEYGTDFASMSPETIAKVRAARAELSKQHPAPRSTFEKYMEHVLYTIELVGIDHVGMGADWDGGGGVDGMSDVTYLPIVTEALLEAGYTEDDLVKFWGGNMMRLLREVEAAKTSEIGSPNVVN